MTDYSNYIDDHIESREELSPVKRFFFACAGAYVRILEICPSEHNKYVGIGGTIFLTACMAVISGSFAIYTLVESTTIAVLFGLLWGSLIFNLDRYIVSSMRKEGKFWYEFGLALPRMILAVLISVVITKPIEIELFRNQINAELSEYTSDLEEDAMVMLDEKLGLDSINSSIAVLENQRKEYKKIKSGEPTSFSFGEVSKEYDVAKSAFEKVKESHEKRITANNRLSDAIWNKHASRVFEEVDGKQVFKRWKIDPTYQKQRYRLVKINQKLQKEIDDKKKVMDDLKESRRQEEEEFKSGMDEELIDIKSKLAELKSLKVARDSVKAIEEPIVLDKARRYGVGFPAKIEALERLKDNSSSIWWTSNLIVLLFIMLETSPVFVKVIVKRGPYDYVLSRIEHQKKIAALQSISDMNYDLNNAVKRHTERLKEKESGQPASLHESRKNGNIPSTIVNGNGVNVEVFTGEEAYDN